MLMSDRESDFKDLCTLSAFLELKNNQKRTKKSDMCIFVSEADIPVLQGEIYLCTWWIKKIGIRDMLMARVI